MSRRSLGWRFVYFVQRAISGIAPPLHSLHWKIFAMILAGLFLPAIYFLWQTARNIEQSHLRSTEQGMIDTALVLADAMSSAQSLEGLSRTREIKRLVFKDLSPNLRVVVYDAEGRVVSDTDNLLKPGTSMAGQPDVRKALQGRYGPRWVRDPGKRVVTLYSTLPVFQKGVVVGAIGIIKPTYDVRRSIIRSLWDLVIPGFLALWLAAGASYLLSNYITRVIQDLASRAERIADGDPDVRLETWTKSELGDLARAVERMRARLEGKAYVEEMASTLSHELKTPLTAIRGAADIVEGSDSPEVRGKFLANIRAEVDRLTGIVNNLLALSRIETQPAPENAACRVQEVAAEVAEAYRRRAETLGLRFEAVHEADGDDDRGERSGGEVGLASDQLRRVIETLLDNAFAFTPRGRSVRLETTPGSITVRDEGGGIDPALQARVFERFFTTANPLTGRRGSGLGLAIARSIVTRAHGEISLESAPGQGATVRVRFPRVG